MTSATEASGFNLDALGNWGETTNFKLDREKIKAYAAATNDPIDAHRKGDLAPPVLAIVPAFEALLTATVETVPPAFMMRVLHGEQDFRFHRPLTPGMTLATRATVIGAVGRTSGVSVTAFAETRDIADDELLVEQYMVSFVRGATLEHPAEVVTVPAHALDPEVAGRVADVTVPQAFDADQTFRYAEASGDPMPIHLDDEVARSMGLPGIIIHGLCTMAFNSWAVVDHACPEDPTRLKRLAVRFSRIVQPGQTVTTKVWDLGGDTETTTYAFQAENEDGEAVIKDGLAEVVS